jgi:hypothetical protein
MEVLQTPPLRHPYKPLQDATQEIRLLQLHSRRRNVPGDDTIRCSLAHTSLGDVGYFEALSYTWGDTTNQKMIQVNGQPFQVTNNLYIALQHLRRDNEARCMWIDAVCINQDDLGERSRQVTQMEHIYQLAKTVVVFLGETWPGRDAAMDFMIAGSQDSTLHLDPSMDHTSRATAWTQVQKTFGRTSSRSSPLPGGFASGLFKSFVLPPMSSFSTGAAL